MKEKKYFSNKMTFRDAGRAADKFGLREAEEFVKQRHPKNNDAFLVGMICDDILVYYDEKTGETFTEPEFYCEITGK